MLDDIADVNDPSRDIDRLDLSESIQLLACGVTKVHTSEISHYVELLRYLCDELHWDGECFRDYRYRIEYSVYGSQVEMVFDPPPPPLST